MADSRAKAATIGIAMLAAGAVYLYMTATLPRRGAVDATTIPYVLAFGMIGLGILQTIMGLRQPADIAASRETELSEEGLAPPAKPSYATVIKTLLLVAAFIMALRPLGFPVAATVYLFFQFIVLTPSSRKPPYGLYAGLALICAIVIFVTFRYGFTLILPAGPLTPYLP